MRELKHVVSVDLTKSCGGEQEEGEGGGEEAALVAQDKHVPDE